MIKNCDKTAELLPSVDEILNKADDVCPVKWAVDAAETAMRNSCGKGTFCRDGLKQLYLIGRDITLNKGSMEDIELLQELCTNMLPAADCELSARCIELFKASLDNHYNDWTAHILRKRCKAGQCEGFPKPAAVGAAAAGGRRRARGGAVVVEDSPAVTAAAPAAQAAEAPAAEAPAESAVRRRRRSGVVEVVEDNTPAQAASGSAQTPVEKSLPTASAEPAFSTPARRTAPVVQPAADGAPRRRRRGGIVEIIED